MPSSTEKLHKPQNAKTMQWIATFAAFLLMLQVGILYGWNSPNISRLTREDSPIPVTSEEASWLLSLAGLGGAAAVIIGAASIEFFGSKITVILSLVVFSISYVCLICASSVEMLYAARTLGGVANVFAFTCYSIYVGEIATPQIRGTLIALSTAGYSVGNVFATIAETYIQMKITSSIYLTMCIADIVLVIWLMNTPYYFVKKNDYKNAKRSIAFYRGNDQEEKIFKDVEKFIEVQSKYTFKDKLRDFRLPIVRQSMVLIAILALLGQICGQTTVMGYMETILKSAKTTIVDPQEFVIYANVISIVSSLSTVKLIDILGRRIMLIISSLGVTVAMIVLGTHFYLLKDNYDPDNLQWLPLFAIIIFVLTLFVGVVPVPSTVLSELFPEHLKSTAAFISSLSSAFLSFITAKVYQSIVDSAGEMYVFWMHAALASLITIPCVLFLMPETKGKSFQEIQEALMKR